MSWESLLGTLDEINLSIHRVWSPIGHLNGVSNSEELRKVFPELINLIVPFSLRMEQSKKIFEGLKKLKNSKSYASFEPAQKRILERKLLSARLSGIALEGEEKEKFNKGAQELSRLSTEFSNNVLDATKNFSMVITKKEDVEGLPASYLERASASYLEKNKDSKSTTKEGPWLITLDHPSFGPFMENSKSRSHREELYLAFITRASEGKLDNQETINQILQLRKEQASILGFSCYADLSLASKMAENVDQVYKLAEDLKGPSQKRAKEELKEVKAYAEKEGGLDPKDFKQWDATFWAKRLQEKKFSYTEEELKPYFSFSEVCKGLFDLAHNLFSITVKEEVNKDVWDEHVTYYNVFDENKNLIASFYLDPYARPNNKRGGAWMNDCTIRRMDSKGDIERPVAYLVCNFTPPSASEPSLLTFREVETMFHEFGHGLQHMLTTINYTDASGINGVDWDAVELPSQFMENWCYHKKTLLGMARHYKTGEVLPEEYYQKLVDSKNYMAATGTLRQLHFALLDMHLHHDFDPHGSKTVFDLQKEIANDVLVSPTHAKDRFLCSFSHIFAGGYSAGYYSYKWAEVLSSDAFSAFEEIDLDDANAVKEVGQKFRDTVLSLGGSIPPMEVFKQFRGREPKVDALLRHNGLS